MNLYQYAKNQTFLSHCSRDIIDLKTLQSDWPGPFWPISQKLYFPPNMRLLKNTANEIKFHYRPNSEKMIKFSSKIK